MAQQQRKARDSAAGPCEVRGHLWVEGPGGAYLGNGRVRLLQEIRAHGSISAAARTMKMSYRHAWRLVDSMNRQAGIPLVVASAGGRGGGGACVTAAGEDAIGAFQDLHLAFQRFLSERSAELRNKLPGKGRHGRGGRTRSDTEAAGVSKE